MWLVRRVFFTRMEVHFARKRSEHQPACKPGSVGHRLACATNVTAIPLGQCCTWPRATYPDGEPDTLPRRYRLREHSALPSLFGFAPGGVCPAIPVAGTAVRSYRTFSPLPEPKAEGRFVLCGTFPGVAPAGRYPSPYVDGARTFLPRARRAGAAVRPTDGLGVGAEAACVKPITACAAAQNKLS